LSYNYPFLINPFPAYPGTSGMPIYEYRCADCGHRLEALQRLADKPLLTCPACGKESLTKLISAVGFQLKGSGWYATDFKHSGSKPPEKTAAKGDAANDGGAKSDSAAATSSSGDAKGDAKPSVQAAGESKPTAGEAKSSPAVTPSKPAATGS
jgi:putative FmdB family regulatory protein